MDNSNQITYFAETDSRNKRVKFGIKAEDRLRHVYSIGKTGMGKSTMLENMAIQDIQNGNGMAFLDPHGKTADLLLDYIPEHRIKDVIYFAPFDTEHPISFNVMEDVGPMRRHLVLSGLMSAFSKLFGEESFSDRMQYILQNTILALLEFPDATMLGINRMLTEKSYRQKVVDNVTDTSVKEYWTKEFASYTDRFAAEATPAIQNKIGQFTSNPLIRNIIGQSKSSFDMREIMDQKKILIVNLSKGLVGESNANLLGSMLVTKIYLAAMSRADATPAELKKLPNFYLYVDEFQSFANKSFADILSEARKYKLGLNITHQYIEQMAEEVRSAVFGNVGTMVAFRVGSFDAEILEKEFAPVFTMEDIVNLGFVQIYLKLMIDGVASKPFSAMTLPPIPKPEVSFREQVLQSSREQYSEKKANVEEKIKKWYEPEIPQPKPQTQNSAPKKVDNNFDKNPIKNIEPKIDNKIVAPTTIKPAPIEVKKTEINNTPIKRDFKNDIPYSKPREQENKNSISLKELSNDPKKKSKEASPQNMSALKEALLKAQKEKPALFVPKKIEEKPKDDFKKNESIISENIKKSDNVDKKKEIPEDVLRKILKGE